MKGSRLVDVLDDMDKLDRTFWNKVFAKMNTLLVAMETAKGNYNIDDPEIRWVSDRIEYWNKDSRILTKNEMLSANVYWKTYKNK
jgi:hypothetical protein